jgi:hypothetical protein
LGLRSFDAGQCGVPSGLSGVTAIAAGTYQSLALTRDGTAVAWGCGASGDFGQCSVPSGLSRVTAIAAGYADSLALKGDGTVVSWGCGAGSDLGQCSVPSGLSPVTAIAASLAHSLALVEPVTPAPCRVPKVVGKPVASAKRTIVQKHCRTGKVSHAYSRKRQKGIVISQSRRPGRVLPARLEDEPHRQSRPQALKTSNSLGFGGCSASRASLKMYVTRSPLPCRWGPNGRADIRTRGQAMSRTPKRLRRHVRS